MHSIYIGTVSSQLLICSGTFVSFLAGLGQKSSAVCMLQVVLLKRPKTSLIQFSKVDRRRKELSVLCCSLFFFAQFSQEMQMQQSTDLVLHSLVKKIYIQFIKLSCVSYYNLLILGRFSSKFMLMDFIRPHFSQNNSAKHQKCQIGWFLMTFQILSRMSLKTSLLNRQQVLEALSNLKNTCEYLLTMTCNSNQMLSGHMGFVGICPLVPSQDSQPAFAENVVAFFNNFKTLKSFHWA